MINGILEKYIPYMGEVTWDGTFTLIMNDFRFRPSNWRKFPQRKGDVSWYIWIYGNNWTCTHPELVGMEKITPHN